jgi:hypothetical protein
LSCCGFLHPVSVTQIRVRAGLLWDERAKHGDKPGPWSASYE